MNPETIDKISQWLTLLTLMAALVGTFVIVGTAAIQSLRNRTVRWDMLAYVLVILWSIPYGIRNYGPELTDAAIDLMIALTDKRPAMESAIRDFIGDDLAGSGDTAVTVPAAEFTSTPFPTPHTDFAATATAYFGDFPTALPVDTPAPEYTATWSLQDFEAEATRAAAGNPTVAPTRFICRTIEDIKAGCQPPTPIPGN